MSKLRYLIAACALVAPAALAQVTVSAAPGAPSPARVAARVVIADGDALLYDRAGALRSARVGDRIHEGDRLLTGVDGELHLAMGDGGYIAVRPGTEMRIDLFKAEGGPADRSEISLIKGSFRTVTGWIGSTGAALIRTFDATIGIRGTDHEPLVVPAGAARGEPGTYDLVHAGATFIRTPEGTVELKPGQAGFVPRGERVPPERLAVVPSLFRPTRNEGRFAGLNDRVKGQLDKLRADRRSDGAERVDRPATLDRPDRPERGRSERPERTRPERPDKPDRGRK
jgi:hypothetical protein